MSDHYDCDICGVGLYTEHLYWCHKVTDRDDENRRLRVELARRDSELYNKELIGMLAARDAEIVSLRARNAKLESVRDAVAKAELDYLPAQQWRPIVEALAACDSEKVE